MFALDYCLLAGTTKMTSTQLYYDIDNKELAANDACASQVSLPHVGRLQAMCAPREGTEYHSSWNTSVFMSEGRGCEVGFPRLVKCWSQI